MHTVVQDPYQLIDTGDASQVVAFVKKNAKQWIGQLTRGRPQVVQNRRGWAQRVFRRVPRIPVPGPTRRWRVSQHHPQKSVRPGQQVQRRSSGPRPHHLTASVVRKAQQYAPFKGKRVMTLTSDWGGRISSPDSDEALYAFARVCV